MKKKLYSLLLLVICAVSTGTYAQSWAPVGSAAFSAGQADFTSMAIDGSGTPYVVYRDNGNAQKATVMKYNGSSWVTVGSPGFSAGVADYTSIAIDGSGTPYVVYRDNGNAQKATVMKYNGSSWVTVGIPGFSAGGTDYTSIAIDGSGTPYVAYRDFGNAMKATVMKYNGSSWVAVGSPGLSADVAYFTPIAIDGSGVPYVAYADYANGDKATVMKYNGSSWVVVGSPGFSAAQANYTSIAIDGSGTLYLAYSDFGSAQKATVMKYNGSSWVAVGSLGFSAGQADFTSIKIDGSGTPYVAYSDYGSTQKATVMKYNGGSWVAVGSPGFSAGTAYYTSMAINGVGIPYVAYGDGSSGNKATVMDFPPPPLPITGTTNVCVTATTTLSDATSLGTWSSSNTGVATVGSISGVVTGVAAGTATITYTTAGGTATTTILVNSIPSAGSISGASGTAPAGTITLSDATSGAGWITNVALPTRMANAAVATYNDNIYVIDGQSDAGYSAIVQIYNATTGTWSSGTPMPQTRYQGDGAAAINGKIYVPGGWFGPVPSSALYIYDPSSDSWSSGTAMPGLSAQGITAQINNILYVTTAANGFSGYANSLYSYDPIADSWTVLPSSPDAHANPAGGVINGKLYVVGGTNSALVTSSQLDVYDPVANSWSTKASMPTPLYAMTGGIINGKLYVAGGDNSTPSAVNTLYVYDPVTDTWSTLATMPTTRGNVSGCTFNNSLYVFGGENGSPSTLTTHEAYTPYTWSSSNTAVATVDQAGNVTGISGGIAFVSYTVGGGCTASATKLITISGGAISGPSSLCVGANITLSDISAGTWSSNAPAIASVGSGTGVVTGLFAGTAVISYNLSGGGTHTSTITVNATPAAIIGPSIVCTSTFVTLSNTLAGGTWSSSNTSAATIGSVSGNIIGVAVGTTTVSYTMGTGCAAGKVITINQSPAAIDGATTVCIGATTILSDALAGGTWSSSNTTKASVGSGSGAVLGVAVANILISYTLNGCTVTSPMTINPLPTSITGTKTVCEGSLTALADGAAGGFWTTASSAIADVGSGDGFVEGILSGTTTITYTLPTGCYNTTTVTVNPLPGAITGSNQACTGQNTQLTDLPAGGAWTSNNATIALVNGGTGVVTGSAVGSTVITYKLSTGCMAVFPITVNASPAAISGTAKVCAGLTTLLTDGTSGGNWSGSGAAGSIDAGGVVTGSAAGTVVVSYALTSGCTVTKVVTVNPLPSAISGASAVCTGRTISLSDIPSGGTWATSDATIATISGLGVVSGVIPGTVAITYQLSTGCINTTIVTVNETPVAITGGASICLGSATALTDATTGGGWTSGAPTVATVDGSGNVTSVALGTSVITYAMPSGCMATRIVTVHPVPTAVFATTTAVCAGATIILSDTTAGGTWSSDNTSIATVSAAHVVTGVAAGTVDITYALNTGCASSITVTVNAVPSPITGSTPICAGQGLTLSDASTGGTWSSAAPLFATVGTSGFVTGIAAGSARISYTFGTGCNATVIVTINALPSAILGSTLLCLNSITSLSDGTPGGTWSTSASIIADITSTGSVTATGVGATIISYTLGTGCARGITVDVRPVPSAILDFTPVCAGSTITLSDTTAGGTWTSFPTSVATIGSASGIVTGVAAGSAVVSYTLSTGCRATASLTVLQSPSAISGATSVCEGFIVTLTDGILGGTWNTSDPSVADIGAGGGIVSGIAAGTALISYTLSNGCMVVRTETVNAYPAAISGTPTVCLGLATSLTDAVAGGTWTSSAPSVASVGSASGIVTGMIANTANITYTLPGGCNISTNITVNPLPSVITGTLRACEGFSTTLSDGVLGGVWSSTNATVATVDATGIVSALSAGTTLISYTLPTGCAKSAVYTVNPMPTAISGGAEVCIGSTFPLSDGLSGGTWSTSAGTIANVGVTSGIVTGISNGTATITYKFTTGCLTTTVVTIDPLPSAITGASGMCIGASITLGEAAGGAWSSGNLAVASVDVTGVVTGVSTGTARITYTLPSGCFTTALVTVNPFPAPINGTTTICQLSTASLSDPTFGGTWSSSSPLVASVNSVGLVTGASGGTSTITYTLPTGCYTTTGFAVNPLPAAIAGASSLCIGGTVTLNDTSAGGTWVSTNTGIATIGSATGIVSAITPGIAHITYTLPTGCKVASQVTVNPLPGAISGTLRVCTGATITISDAVSGGTWSSSDMAIATIGIVSGSVEGVSPGTAVITYTLGTGCIRTATFTVNPSPAPISGAASVCVGATFTVSDVSPGGVWSTITSGVATVGSGTGLVTGIGAGSVAITYTLGGVCKTTTMVTINPVPTSILGARVMCAGSTSSLSDPSPLGVWSSSNSAVAVADLTTGVVSGISAGTATITYTLPAGCYTTSNVTINPFPAPISGPAQVCIGATITLSDAVTGGSWTSSSIAVATVGISTGVVLGVSHAAVTITYTLPAGCKTTTSVYVNLVPAAIAGTPNMCVGAFTGLSDVVTGGTWASSNTAIASVGSGSGVVTGTAAGTATITYTLGNSCFKTTPVTVNPVPVAITGTGTFCATAVTTLSDASPGGHWSSSSTAVATVGSVTGVLTAVSAGSALITYKFATGCLTTGFVSVNPLPAPIIGPANVCAGTTLFLSDATAGGLWHSSNTGFATIDGTGNVVTISAGKDTITYTLPTGCLRTFILTVNPLPAVITGAGGLCAGSTLTLSDASPGGTWSTGNATIATVGSTGIVTGVAEGTTTISYKLVPDCGVTTIVTVNAIPSAIFGVNHICTSTLTLLTDAIAGGTWSTSDSNIAAIGVFSGVFVGVSSGTATITYTLSGGCMITTQVTVSALPFAGTISGASAICVGTSTTLSDAIPDGIWSSSDTAVASIDSSGHVVGLSLGTATITYAVSQFCGDTVTTAEILIKPLPYAAHITGNTSICIHGTTTLHDSVTGGVWTSNNHTLAVVDTGGIVTGNAAGTVLIKYSVSNSCGTAVTSIFVTVNPFAALSPIAIHTPASVCTNTEFQNFGAGSPPPSGVQYAWSVYGADIYAQSPNHENCLVSFPNEGTATLILSAQVTNTGCRINDSFVVDVRSSESPNLQVTYYSSEFVCSDNKADGYQWGYDDAVTLDSTRIRGATFQDYYLPNPDFTARYYWVMTLHNGCLQKSYYNTPAAGVKHVTVNNLDILVYPNPADARVYIEVKGQNSNGNINAGIYDMLGKNVKAETLIAGKGVIDISGLAPGVYSVMLTQNGARIGVATFVKK